MYANITKTTQKPSIMYECLNCENTFVRTNNTACCPVCLSQNRSNLVIIHMEEDAERAEWLELVDFSAGD
jgi:Zn finger protein HypA/HybF involved in hydrogenase expression